MFQLGHSAHTNAASSRALGEVRSVAASPCQDTMVQLRTDPRAGSGVIEQRSGTCFKSPAASAATALPNRLTGREDKEQNLEENSAHSKGGVPEHNTLPLIPWNRRPKTRPRLCSEARRRTSCWERGNAGLTAAASGAGGNNR